MSIISVQRKSCNVFVLRSPENTTSVILAKTGSYSPKKDYSTL